MIVSRIVRKGGGAVTTHPIRSPLDITLHWVTVLLVLLTLGIIAMRTGVEDHDWRYWLRDAHRLIGLVLFGVTMLRLGHRFVVRGERLRKPLNWPAALVHTAILLSLLVMPLIGLIQAAAERNKPTLFSTIPLPALIDKNRDLAELLVSVHSDLGLILIALICLHVMAALWHQFYLRDGLINTMMPEKLNSRKDA